MSNQSNDVLFDRAADMVAYWENKIPADVILADISRDDLEALALHTAEAEAMASQEEFEASDVV